MLQEGVAVNYMTSQKSKIKTSKNFNLEPEDGTRIQRILLNIGRRNTLIKRSILEICKKSLTE